MTDFQRIAEIYATFPYEMRNFSSEKKSPLRSPIDSMRTRYWYEGLKQRTHLSTAYALEKYFEKESFQRNSNGTIRHYRSKWEGYDNDLNTPKSKTLKRVELLAPGSTREVEHPLWEIMRHVAKKGIELDSYMRKLSVDVQEAVYSSGFSGLCAYSKREPITQRMLDKLEKRASLDSVACLICLILEAIQQNRDSSAVKAVNTLHNVLLMVGIELQSRHIALPFLDWVIEHILPLGVLPHLKVSMASSDYVQASAYLNAMVYQNKSRRGKSLEWPQRVKIMHRLIHGKMGMDVEFAMRPRFELRPDIKDISPEIIEDFESASRFRSWGWKCILEGRSEPFPPAQLFLSQHACTKRDDSGGNLKPS
ncbi:MAG: hypothetical protein KKC24_01205 [Gammaproteobacteria bacterium]|nr:hypothetical protein [Gammaproteobacteria bacterium]MBU0817454.1 hypothetical protein [Gammaproteobacteria bacterium]MBU0845134.1 hypothetical protein [Gammaproteobacteria bacterium]MBU1839871.1 hypothetical protein [Gammaproteobacteria bacterium]